MIPVRLIFAFINKSLCLCVIFLFFFSGDLQVGSVPFAEQDVHLGTLQIRGVQEKDAGEYSCVARNPAGTSSATVILEVGGE